jgi:hypothetical protein
VDRLTRRCASRQGESNSNYRKTSVRSSSLFTVRLQRPDFDVVVQKLIFELQAFSQGIRQTSIMPLGILKFVSPLVQKLPT